MDKKTRNINKFESEERLIELSIKENLETLGFSKNMTLADIGSGTGVLIFEAYKYEKSKIYSLEMSDIMIEIQKDKIEKENIKNIEIIKQDVDKFKISIEDKSCDIVTMITVLHEIDDKEGIMKEIKRILKPNGKLLIIEFHKKQTDFGPPLDERLSREDIESISKEKFKVIEQNILGDNFYRVILQSK